MSASPIARQAHTHAQLIPAMRKVLISDPSQMPDVYSSTPNGSLYSTTPGGTKIVYERTFLLNLKNSPLSQSPPPKNIPCHLMKEDNSAFHNHNHQNQMNGTFTGHPPKNNHHKTHNSNSKTNNKSSTEWRRPSAASAASDDHQFDMDI